MGLAPHSRGPVRDPNGILTRVAGVGDWDGRSWRVTGVYRLRQAR
jgi:hypothetical protein